MLQRIQWRKLAFAASLLGMVHANGVQQTWRSIPAMTALRQAVQRNIPENLCKIQQLYLSSLACKKMRLVIYLGCKDILPPFQFASAVQR